MEAENIHKQNFIKPKLSLLSQIYSELRNFKNLKDIETNVCYPFLFTYLNLLNTSRRINDSKTNNSMGRFVLLLLITVVVVVCA